MSYTYTKIDDHEFADDAPRYEIDEVCGFSICVVEEEDVAQLFCAAPDLLFALKRLVARDRAEAAESGFTDDEMTWLDEARAAIAKAEGGAS